MAVWWSTATLSEESFGRLDGLDKCRTRYSLRGVRVINHTNFHHLVPLLGKLPDDPLQLRLAHLADHDKHHVREVLLGACLRRPPVARQLFGDPNRPLRAQICLQEVAARASLVREVNTYEQIGPHWRHRQLHLCRRLNPRRQALLALAHLRNGDTYTRLAAGFQIGVTTAWRYVQGRQPCSAWPPTTWIPPCDASDCWPTQSWTARSSPSTGSPIRSPTTPENINVTA
jgi:hypothetical protein